MQSKPKVLQRFDTKPPLGYVEVKRVQILQRIRNSMDSTEQLKIIKNSRHLHRKWYRTTYPDVAELGMDPAEHYLRYGATMGRNPGKVFDTQFYLETYPDVAESGLNPLVHYVLHGEEEGRRCKPRRPNAAKKDEREIFQLRIKLLGLGFTEQPLKELKKIVDSSPRSAARALAARELALWHMQSDEADGYQAALEFVARARSYSSDRRLCSQLTVLELICHYRMNQPDEGALVYERAALAGEVTLDAVLARANFESTLERRLSWINAALGYCDISPIALTHSENQSAYERLTTAEPITAVADGARVTVLLPAHNAADVLPTSLRSLQEQSWKNLEIIVIDDGSSDNGATCAVVEHLSAEDPRIRLIRMPESGGPYVACNRGLVEASGEYLVMHKASEWSHPRRIETQVRYMEAVPDAIGCATQQATVNDDLEFTQFTQDMNLVTTRAASFLWRRESVMEKLKCWDPVRRGADVGFVERATAIWGADSVVCIPSSLLAFQCNQAEPDADDLEGSVLFGALKEYSELRNLMIQEGILEGASEGECPVPLPIRSRRNVHNRIRHFDVIIASDFRLKGGSTQSSLQEILAHKKHGIRTGLVPMYRYDFPVERMMEKVVRDEIDEELVQVLTHGDRASCELLILRYPSILQYPQRYLPRIDAKQIKVIVNQPPMSDYGPNAVVRYDLAVCVENIRRMFGKDAIWHPIGPLVRDALQQYHADQLGAIQLAADDWHNIIDIDDWSRGAYTSGNADVLRIGRHSRDHEHKWPNRRDDILAAYPSSDDIEVRVLGGVTSIQPLIGRLPKNWRVFPFGSVHPREFLKDLDVWVYFSHPEWVESFGRTIIEAMAVGVPVILPEDYRSLFQDAACYSTPREAVAFARMLHGDREKYVEQVEAAQQYVSETFSFQAHLRRLRQAGIETPGAL